MDGMIKLSFIIFLVVQLISGLNVLQAGLVLLLVILAIVRIKYLKHPITLLIEYVLIMIGIHFDPRFGFLFGSLAFDVAFEGYYWGLVPIGMTVYLLFPTEMGTTLIFLLCLCGYFGQRAQQQEERERKLQTAYDEERKVRFQLEETKDKLLATSREVAHIAEVKERNRIAGTIHDHAGHRIAGLLMQLQVVEKLFEREPEKSRQLLRSSIEGLSKALVYLRETVHNIQPTEALGVAAIQEIIDSFLYCPVDFKLIGDVGDLTPQHFHLVLSIMKETLTNITKHSKAIEVTMKLEINEEFVRLYVKDNGIGCKQIKPNLGLGGMQERVRNLGGTLSINGEDGFLIVCMLPQNPLRRWNP